MVCLVNISYGNTFILCKLKNHAHFNILTVFISIFNPDVYIFNEYLVTYSVLHFQVKLICLSSNLTALLKLPDGDQLLQQSLTMIILYSLA